MDYPQNAVLRSHQPVCLRSGPLESGTLAWVAQRDEEMPECKPGVTSLNFDSESALCQHNYPETVPLLAPFAGDAVDKLAGKPNIA
jgi:hypothetical protein